MTFGASRENDQTAFVALTVASLLVLVLQCRFHPVTWTSGGLVEHVGLQPEIRCPSRILVSLSWLSRRCYRIITAREIATNGVLDCSSVTPIIQINALKRISTSKRQGGNYLYPLESHRRGARSLRTVLTTIKIRTGATSPRMCLPEGTIGRPMPKIHDATGDHDQS